MRDRFGAMAMAIARGEVVLKYLAHMILGLFLAVMIILTDAKVFERWGPFERSLGLLIDEYDDIVNYPGAVGSGVLDASRFETIQDAIDFAHEGGYNIVQLEGRTYDIETALLLYSGMTLQGTAGKTIISMTGVNMPVIKHSGSIAGHTTIRDLTVTGDVTQIENAGILLNDYYSTIDNVTVANVGGQWNRILIKRRIGHVD